LFLDVLALTAPNGVALTDSNVLSNSRTTAQTL
jgi:hypothetical protein